MLLNADHVRDYKRAYVSLSFSEFQKLEQVMQSVDCSQLATVVRELALERAAQINQAKSANHTQSNFSCGAAPTQAAFVPQISLSSKLGGTKNMSWELSHV